MKTTITTIIVCLLATVTCSAQWQLIDDFQQWEDGDIFTDAADIGWHACSEDQTDEYWMLQDPFDHENIGMYVNVETGNSDNFYAKTFVMKALPGDGIDRGETGTLFFRCLWYGLTLDWHMATADMPLVFDDDTGLQVAPGAYEDLNAVIRIDSSGTLKHRDGDGYVATNPPQIPQIYKWYSFWMVVENTWDMTTTPLTSTGVHTLYVQGEGIGDGVSPTLIPVGTDPPKESATFRRSPADDDGNPQAIIWAVFASGSRPSMSSGYDTFLLDDLYFSKGENLSSPLDWADYTIEPSGDVDTGSFLGWLNVAQAPYIWSYALNGWIYMEEPAADAPGAWGYFFK